MPAHSTPGSAPGPASPIDSPPLMPIRPWRDPVVDDDGFEPRSRYVETFWLGVLGPTATWLLRRFADHFDREPDGFVLDLLDTARSMGLGFSRQRSSPFTKAIQRCVMFGLAHPTPDHGLAVRRRIPPIAHRHLRRLPDSVQQTHHDWVRHRCDLDEFDRAHHLALAMHRLGDEAPAVERQLLTLGLPGAIASQVADNVSALERAHRLDA